MVSCANVMGLSQMTQRTYVSKKKSQDSATMQKGVASPSVPRYNCRVENTKGKLMCKSDGHQKVNAFLYAHFQAEDKNLISPLL